MHHHLVRSIPLLGIVALLASCSPPPVLDACLPEQGATGVFVSGSGNDASGDGSLTAPYRSLTQALVEAPLGATIRVLCGTFSDASGEAFPLDLSGRSVVGLGADLTSLAYESTAPGVAALVVFDGTATVKGLELTGFTGDAIDLRGGTTTIEDVQVIGAGDGSIVRASGGAVVELLRVDLSDAGDEGVYVRDTASIRVVDSVIRDSGNDGIDVEHAATLFVRGTRITGSASAGIETSSSGTIDLGTVDDPGGNTITGNAEWQIQDRRDPTVGPTLMAIGNDFGAPVSGIQTGPSSLVPVWEIVNAGNQIDFGAP